MCHVVGKLNPKDNILSVFYIFELIFVVLSTSFKHNLKN